MYAIYGNMDPINIPQMLAYIPAPWIRHGIYIHGIPWMLQRWFSKKGNPSRPQFTILLCPLKERHVGWFRGPSPHRRRIHPCHRGFHPVNQWHSTPKNSVLAHENAFKGILTNSRIHLSSITCGNTMAHDCSSYQIKLPYITLYSI